MNERITFKNPIAMAINWLRATQRKYKRQLINYVAKTVGEWISNSNLEIMVTDDENSYNYTHGYIVGYRDDTGLEISVTTAELVSQEFMEIESVHAYNSEGDELLVDYFEHDSDHFRIEIDIEEEKQEAVSSALEEIEKQKKEISILEKELDQYKKQGLDYLIGDKAESKPQFIEGINHFITERDSQTNQ